MAKKFCKDHQEKKSYKPQCASCVNSRDGSHAKMLADGIVLKGRLSEDVELMRYDHWFKSRME